MKKTKLNKWLQKPLRFHHQDLHDEIEGLTAMLVAINNRLIVIERLLLEITNELNNVTFTKKD